MRKSVLKTVYIFNPEIHAITMYNHVINQSFAIWSLPQSDWHFAVLSCQINLGFMHFNQTSHQQKNNEVNEVVYRTDVLRSALWEHAVTCGWQESDKQVNLQQMDRNNRTCHKHRQCHPEQTLGQDFLFTLQSSVLNSKYFKLYDR